MEDPQLWMTATVLLLMLVALVRELASPAALVLGALVALLLLGVVPADRAFAGFSSQATLTLAGLFVVARAVRDHTGLDRLVTAALGDGSHPRRSLLRLTAPTALLSGFVTNTPLVATMAPLVRGWAERHGQAASRYLMPLSFVAIAGGTITVIGTSPTLLVSGLLQETTGTGLAFLEVTPVGLPLAVAATTLVVVLAPRILPDRRTSQQLVSADERHYTLPMRILPDGPLDGVSVGTAGLRNLQRVFLARIHRGPTELAPVGPDEVLLADDVLVFVGQVDEVNELAERAGLAHTDATQVHLLEEGHDDRFEVVLGRNSPLVGKTLKGLSFRGRYSAVVLALHRAGARVDHKLGGVRLESGDSLLVQASPGFEARWSDRSDFAVIVPLDDGSPQTTGRRWLVLGIAAAMIGAAALGADPVLVAVVAACAALVGTRTLSFFAAKDSLDLDVIVVVASAIGLGTAVETSGLAVALADGMTSLVPVDRAAAPWLAIVIVVLATLLLTELVTNIAAAAIALPIALDVAAQVGSDPRGFAVAVAIGASASYLSPIGYQTNTIVYALGGYRFTDYWRLGLPITLAVLVLTPVLVTLFWG